MDDAAALQHQDAIGHRQCEVQHLFGDDQRDLTQLADFVQGVGNVLDDSRLDAVAAHEGNGLILGGCKSRFIDHLALPVTHAESIHFKHS
ncbi:MAG: hypothetical protein WBN85_10660 [Candidatus Macondimonas sp.]